MGGARHAFVQSTVTPKAPWLAVRLQPKQPGVFGSQKQEAAVLKRPTCQPALQLGSFPIPRHAFVKAKPAKVRFGSSSHMAAVAAQLFVQAPTLCRPYPQPWQSPSQ